MLKTSLCLRGSKALWRKKHYPLIGILLKCKEWTRFFRKQRLEKCPNGQVTTIFARSPKTRLFLNSAKGGPIEIFQKSPKKQPSFKRPKSTLAQTALSTNYYAFKIFALKNPEFKILADFKILGFENPEFQILAEFKIQAFQNPEFKVMADFKILGFQNPKLKILADFKILAFQNPELQILAISTFQLFKIQNSTFQLTKILNLSFWPISRLQLSKIVNSRFWLISRFQLSKILNSRFLPI